MTFTLLARSLMDAEPMAQQLIDALETHKMIHSGIKPFKCDTCSSSFSRIGSLKTHKLIHSGLRPFKCDLCPSTFMRKNNLKFHKLIHSGVKAFKCDICPWEFAANYQLRKHKMTHKPKSYDYECNICQSLFSCKSGLKRH